MILEDDVSFVRDFREKWKAAVEKLDGQEWSMFYPGHALDGLPAGLALLEPGRSVLCAHFLVIEARALPTIIAGLEAILNAQQDIRWEGQCTLMGHIRPFGRRIHS